MKIVRGSLVAATLLVAVHSSAQTVIRDGREWLQPIDFLNVTWNEVDALCPAPSRVCSGSLGPSNIDISGYTFASTVEVNALMASYGVPAPDFEGTTDEPWAPLVFADFTPTLVDAVSEWVLGFTSTSADSDNANIIWVHDGVTGATSLGDAHWLNSEIKTSPQLAAGVWLYRALPTPAKSIPTMGILGLALTGLGAMLIGVRYLGGRRG